MSGYSRGCSPYAAYYPVCPMCEIITRLSCAALSPLVTISVTEIDWETYMHHVKLYLDGERDYSVISGPTGPLV